MRFGLSMYPFDRYPTRRSVLETARLVEGLGFDAITIGEHVITPRAYIGQVPAKWYDSLTLGATIAGATERVKILFSILVVPYYNPVRLAKALSSLDVLSEGRVIVGAGAGWLKSEFEILGASFEERGAVFDEYLAAMKELWTSNDPRFDGRWVKFGDLVFDPPPYQKPHPPIWIGGHGQNAIRRAVALGDGLYPGTNGPLSRIIARKQETERRLEAAGRDPATFTFAHAIDYGGTTKSKYDKEMTPIGGREHMAFALDETEQMLAHVAEADAAGISYISVRFPGRDHLEVGDSIRRFHAEVMRPAAAKP